MDYGVRGHVMQIGKGTDHVQCNGKDVFHGEGGAPERGDPPPPPPPPPKGGLATLPTTPPPLVGGSAREVSDLAVSLNVVGVGVGAQW